MVELYCKVTIGYNPTRSALGSMELAAGVHEWELVIGRDADGVWAGVTDGRADLGRCIVADPGGRVWCREKDIADTCRGFRGLT